MTMMNRRWLVFFTLIYVLALTTIPASAQTVDCEAYQGSPQASAPDFPTDLDWINLDGALSIEDLQGKIVLLDFWTYGCINCLHMIPTIDRLEREYEEELVVIGVHSAKFENEGQTENIREIVQRYELHHPVINDFDFDVWTAYRPYGVNAWPTFVLIDPRGNIFAVQSGEIPYSAFDSVISRMAACFDSQGEINPEPIAIIDPELDYAPPRILNYPGKVLADAEGQRLFIADSVNHRLVIADLSTYEVLHVIGTGQHGYLDGSYETAQFYKPQGMALRDEVLYVADTFNHTIRAVDLTEQTITTIAGTGLQGRTIPQNSVFPAIVTDLRSPWDVEFGEDDNTLYIAMAGTHQIWVMDLTLQTLTYAVGNGREAQLNLSLLDSELAQPSGLYYQDGLLYFADSESSTIRVADTNADEVFVASGTTDNSLFDYGDADGAPGESRLQHALGVVGDGEGLVYIADTYNSKIRVLSDDDLVTETLSGGDQSGFADGPLSDALFNEPGGLDYANGLLYVADTNNHAIRVIDVEAETVSTVTFPNPDALQIDGGATVIGGNAFAGAVTLTPQTVRVGDGEIVLDILLPEGYKINDLAPSIAQFNSSGDVVGFEDDRIAIEDTTLTVPVTFEAGEDTLLGSFDVYYCEAINESLCFIEQFAVEIPLTVATDEGESQVNIEREIIPPVGFEQGIG
jgi:thiol-disulfide isomerase/thioredoxin